jgi:diketogulonate reductase-like aldo/keto reductase
LGYASTKIEFEKSLKRLNPDYVYLYLIDWAHKAKNHDDWQIPMQQLGSRMGSFKQKEESNLLAFEISLKNILRHCPKMPL